MSLHVTELAPEEDSLLDHYFCRPFTLRRLRRGSAGPLLERFAKTLFEQGHAQVSGYAHVAAARHLTEWAVKRGVAVADLGDEVLARFGRHLPRCRCNPGRRHRSFRGVVIQYGH